MGKYNVCAKHLPNMAKYPQHLEISQLPMTVLAIDTIGHLPVTSKGNIWALTAIFLLTYYVFAIMMKVKSAENAAQANMSGILAHKGGNVATLSDNGTEFGNKVLNEVCDQLGIKRLFSNPFHPQGNATVENVHNFLKGTLPKFLDSSDIEWSELLPFACYCYNIFPGSNGIESPFFLMFGQDPTEGCLTHLNNNRYYETNEGKVVLEELHKLWKHHTKHISDLC